MLRRPDTHTANVLALADFLDNLPNERFNLAKWGHERGNWRMPLEEQIECGTPACIAGWGARLWGMYNERGSFSPYVVAEKLGLTEQEDENALFNPGMRLPCCYAEVTPKMAAKVLRHLAVTGEVDWNQVAECLPSK